MSLLPRIPRVPTPVRLLLSYLLVIALGAVPTFFYLWQETFRQLTVNSARELADSGARLQQLMLPLTLDQRLALARQYAELTAERVTYLNMTGLVLYDSEANPQTMENHLKRPEVQIALHQLEHFKGGVDIDLPGMGIAQRDSSTTGFETLYVAVLLPVPGASPPMGDIVRLARRVAQIRTVTNDSLDFARNSQAVAVSAAILLSLLAAVIFTRPLHRVAKAADGMAAGDLAIQLGKMGDDEIGDVGRSLERMALSLRRRLADSRSGEAMIAQLAEALELPLVVVELDGELVAINGEGRRLLQLGALELGAHTSLATPAFREAMERAEREGEPERVALPLPGNEGVSIPCILHLLKRPGLPSLCAIVGEDWGTQHGFLAPDPRSVRPIGLKELLNTIHERVSVLMGLTGTVLELPRDLPDVKVADVEARLFWGTLLLLVECAAFEHVRLLAPVVEIKPAFVVIELLEVRAAPGVLNVLRTLWEPLGGEALQTERHVILRWPRA